VDIRYLSIFLLIVPCLLAGPAAESFAGDPAGTQDSSMKGSPDRTGLLAAGLNAWRDGREADAAQFLRDAGENVDPADLILEDYRLYHQALAEMSEGSWREAEKCLIELTGSHSDSRFYPEGLLALAKCRWRNDDFEGARESLAVLSQSDPGRGVRRRLNELELAVRLDEGDPADLFYDSLTLFGDGRGGGVFPVIDFLSRNERFFYELPFARKVRPGDTLFEIAADCRCDLDSLIAWNKIGNPDRIKTGTLLTYYISPAEPRTGPRVSHVVKHGETLSGIAAAYGTTTKDLLLINRIANPERIAAGRKLLVRDLVEHRPSDTPRDYLLEIEPTPGFFLEATSRYFSRGSRVSALEAAEIGISIHPSLGEWPGMHHLLGRVCMSLKRLTKADQYFVAAIKGAGENEELRSAARLDRIENAWRAGKHHRIPELLAMLEKGSPAPDRLVRGLFFSGLSATDDGRTEFVIRLKKKMDAAVSSPGGVSGLGKACSFYWVLGRYFFHKELYGDAFDTFSILAGFGNGYEEAALFWKGLCQQRLNRIEEHDAIMTRLFEAEPFSYYGLTAARRIGIAAECDSGYVPVPGIVSYLETNLRHALENANESFPERGHLRKGLRLIELGIRGHDLAELELGGASINHDNRAVRAVFLLSMARNSRFGDLGDAAAELFSDGSLDRIPECFTEQDLFGYPLTFRELIERESAVNELDPALVAALIRRESIFQPEVISRAGAIGLMQIMPQTCRDIGVAIGEGETEPANMFNPELNIRYGTFYLAGEIEAFCERLPLALAAYNAGRDPVNRWVDEFGYDPEEPEIFIDMIQYGETRMYVKKVLAAREVYARLYGLGLFHEQCKGSADRSESMVNG